MSGLVEVIFGLIYLVFFLFVLTISIIYMLGYIYDALFGKWLAKLGIFIVSKISILKKCDVLTRVEGYLTQKDMYMRYETPLCTYCFSLSALLVISEIIDGFDSKYILEIATILYIFVYFVGMYRRCRPDAYYYSRVLENNMEFLKLSFIPLTFLITIVGFLFTITGFRIQELDLNIIDKVIKTFTEHDVYGGIVGDILYYVRSSFIILIIMYITSIPMQLISYFIIQSIFYFKKHNNAYRKLIKCYIDILKLK